MNDVAEENDDTIVQWVTFHLENEKYGIKVAGAGSFTYD